MLLLIRKGADTLTRDEMNDAYYVITHIHQTLSCNVHGPYTDDKAQRLLTFTFITLHSTLHSRCFCQRLHRLFRWTDGGVG